MIGSSRVKTELQEKLNQESARVEMIMKSEFYLSNSYKPYDGQVNKQYFELLKLMAKRKKTAAWRD